MGGANPRQSNGAARRALVRWLKDTGDHVCWICGLPIDMGLKHPDPWSWSCDEVLPVSLGGSPYDRGNVREAHLHCNCSRGNRALPAEAAARLSFEVSNSRSW